jgi:nucleoside-diphosphate-sugar epimerase
MKVLFIGGTGNISTACSQLALEKGYEMTLLHRGHTEAALEGARAVIGSRDDAAFMKQVAADTRYDVVANFVGMTPEQIELDLAAFTGRVGQYIYISSASAYQKPPRHYLITEQTPLANPYWAYARQKIACEERLLRAHREQGFPVTIVRPSYTFGPTWIPSGVGGHGYTIVGRMRQGLPVISHGDGQSLWVMTYHTDFAVGFVGLFGQAQALGEAFHITSDEVLTWDQIYRTIAQAAGGEAHLVHIPSDFIAAANPPWAGGLLGDKAYSAVFDNSKIKRVVPEFRTRVSFAEGIARSIAWHDADPARQVIDPQVNQTMNHIIAVYQRALEQIRAR